MKQTARILFIGNSHTYYNDMPLILKAFSLISPQTQSIEPVIIAHGGKALSEHKIEPEVRFNILFGDYQYIVLQQVAHPFTGGKKELVRDGLEINEFIKKTKAKPITYLTWAEKSKQENQSEMNDAYLALNNEINGLFCPVGIVWQLFIAQYPEVDLYDADGEHSNEIGSYLVACVFFTTIFKTTPLGLPSQIKHNNELILEVPDNIAKNIQTLVWEYFNI